MVRRSESGLATGGVVVHSSPPIVILLGVSVPELAVGSRSSFSVWRSDTLNRI